MSRIYSSTARTIKGSLVTTPRDWLRWRSRDFAAPAPQSIKWSVLRRHGARCQTWIETGTYRADTTVWLSSWAKRVISIEPQPDLFAAAVKRTSSLSNVTIYNGSSEDVLEGILQNVDGPVGFWLDGHYSGGSTYKGTLDTPIVQELEQIGTWIAEGHRATILIDDFRLFPNEQDIANGYPGRRWLIEWSIAHELAWSVENDIFVAWSPSGVVSNKEAG